MKTVQVCWVWERARRAIGPSLSSNVIFFRRLREKELTRIVGPDSLGDFQKALKVIISLVFHDTMGRIIWWSPYCSVTISCWLPSRYVIGSASWPPDLILTVSREREWLAVQLLECRAEHSSGLFLSATMSGHVPNDGCSATVHGAGKVRWGGSPRWLRREQARNTRLLC